MTAELTAALDRAFSFRRLVARLDRELDRRLGPVERYDACNWITVGAQAGDDGREGGTPVCIDAKGKITKGPKALTGRSIKRLSGQSLSAKRNQSVTDAAKQHGVDRKALETAVEDVWREKRQLAEQRERAKRVAREFTGLTEADIARIENSHRDWSTVPRFDEVADELASNFPELGLDPRDPGPGLWDLLREGKRDLPTKHDPAIVTEAAERLQSAAAEPAPGIDDDRFSRMHGEIMRELYQRGLATQPF